MNRCAVQAVWTMAEAGSDAGKRDDELRDRIVPGVTALPGFVLGIWARSADGTRSHNTIVFEDPAGADALVAQIEANKPRSTAAGVHLHSLEIMDVIVEV
jgi:hypothetical protein